MLMMCFVECTVWKNSYFSVTADSPFMMRELIIKEYFGVNLAMTHKSCFKMLVENVT